MTTKPGRGGKGLSPLDHYKKNFFLRLPLGLDEDPQPTASSSYPGIEINGILASIFSLSIIFHELIYCVCIYCELNFNTRYTRTDEDFEQ